MHPNRDDSFENEGIRDSQQEVSFKLLKRKSTLATESKDLLRKLNVLKKEMQKNLNSDSMISSEHSSPNGHHGMLEHMSLTGTQVSC